MSRLMLVDEDFQSFPIGYLPFLYTAHGEYHHMQPPGRLYPWYESTCSTHHRAAGWAVFEEDGRHYLQHSLRHDKDRIDGSILAIGNELWSDYTAEMRLRVLSRAPSGLLVRYLTARSHIRIVLDGARLSVVHRDDTEFRVLAETDAAVGFDKPAVLSASVEGAAVTVKVDGEKRLKVDGLPLERGRVGIFAGGTADFYSVKAWMDEKCYGEFRLTRSGKQREEETASEAVPQAVLLKRVALHGRAAGRQLRIGDINGDGRNELVLARCVKRNNSDAFNHIRSLTAIDLEGNILWEFGVPGRTANAASGRTNDPRAPEIITADLPFQVYDLDGDGKDEVILFRHFQMLVLDGTTGEITRRAPAPFAPEGHEDDFVFLNVDAVLFADLSGRGRATEILIKNRYKDLWALDSDFNVLWTRSLMTGHFPAPCDLNGDGKDEIVCCYTALNPDGSTFFNTGITHDHVDEIVAGRFKGAGEPLEIAVSAGDEGFMVWDLEGSVLHRELPGHAQRISAAPYRPDMQGLQFFVTTYWGEPGITSFHDCAGKRLWYREIPDNGQVISPVDWSAQCPPLCLINGCLRHGGMMDSWGRRVVRFPDDGHPDLCADVCDLLATGREQVLLWDEDVMYVYGAEDTGDEPRSLRRFPPEYNRSNYRGEALLPIEWD